jgi:phosphomannomutase/phosphoglucomutase
MFTCENHDAKIIGDVKCSQVMFDDIKEHGGIPVMWKTGHSLIKRKMKEEQALIAGELSGHIFIADRYFGFDDAIYTTIRLVEIMKKTGKNMNELLQGIPRMHFTPEIRIDCPDETKKRAVEKVVKRFEEYNNGTSPVRIKGLDTTDGVRVRFEHGWGLIRTSNTQPVIVVRAEAEDEESLAEYRAFIDSEIKVAMGEG